MWSNAIYTFYMVVRGGWVAIKSTLRTRDSSCIPMFALVADSCTSLPPCYPTPKRFLLVSNFPNWWITISFSERHSPSVPPLLLNCTMWGRVYWLTSVRHDVIINLCTPLMNTVPTPSVVMNIDHLCIICGDVTLTIVCCDDEYWPCVYFLQFLSFQLSCLKSWIKVFKHSSSSR